MRTAKVIYFKTIILSHVFVYLNILECYVALQFGFRNKLSVAIVGINLWGEIDGLEQFRTSTLRHRKRLKIGCDLSKRKRPNKNTEEHAHNIACRFVNDCICEAMFLHACGDFTLRQ